MDRLLAAADVGLTNVGATLSAKIVSQFGREIGGRRSKSGSAPNVQTGELSRSIGYSKAVGLRNVVGFGLFYG